MEDNKNVQLGNICIDDCLYDAADSKWIQFDFHLIPYVDLFDTEEDDCDYVNLYLCVNPFTDDVVVEVEEFVNGYGSVNEIPLSGDMKKIFREAAEKYIQGENGISLLEYCS